MPLEHLFRWPAVGQWCPSCAQGFDLVIHTAGPFQWKLTSSVLEAAIAAKVPYIDVADDADFSAVRVPYPSPYVPYAESSNYAPMAVSQPRTMVYVCERADRGGSVAVRLAVAWSPFSLVESSLLFLMSSHAMTLPLSERPGLADSSHVAVPRLRLNTSSLLCSPEGEGLPRAGGGGGRAGHHDRRHLPGHQQRHGGAPGLPRPEGPALPLASTQRGYWLPEHSSG